MSFFFVGRDEVGRSSFILGEDVLLISIVISTTCNARVRLGVLLNKSSFSMRRAGIHKFSFKRRKLQLELRNE